jgi:hypothetical protein
LQTNPSTKSTIHAQGEKHGFLVMASTKMCIYVVRTTAWQCVVCWCCSTQTWLSAALEFCRQGGATLADSRACRYYVSQRTTDVPITSRGLTLSNATKIFYSAYFGPNSGRGGGETDGNRRRASPPAPPPPRDRPLGTHTYGVCVSLSAGRLPHSLSCPNGCGL